MRGDGRKDRSREEEEGKRDQEEGQDRVNDPVKQRGSRKRSVPASLLIKGALDAEEGRRNEGRKKEGGRRKEEGELPPSLSVIRLTSF